MDIQRMILSANPDYESTNIPDSPWRKKFHYFVSHPSFEKTIMGFIMLNMIQMACLHETQSYGFTTALKYSNYFFTVVFIIEATLKLIAYGRSYFDNSWQRFDFFVVVASLMDVAMDVLPSDSLAFLKDGPVIARVLRVLRVTRVVRLAGKYKNLQTIIETITFSLPALANVLLLLVLVFFMFSVLANYGFKKINSGVVINDVKNFRNM